MFGGDIYKQAATLPNKVLTLDEIREVLRHLQELQVGGKQRKVRRKFFPDLLADDLADDVQPAKVLRHNRRNLAYWQNLILFRLSCCCGLRRKEIHHLRLHDLELYVPRPFIRVRSEATKASAYGPGHSRNVPLWWDKSTLNDLRDYAAFLGSRKGPEGETDNPYVMFHSITGKADKPVAKKTLQSRWKTCLSVLREHRRLGIHCGRHSFCSHALRAGRTLVEVQRAAGHRWIMTTQIYLHALEAGRDLPDVFPEEEEID